MTSWPVDMKPDARQRGGHERAEHRVDGLHDPEGCSSFSIFNGRAARRSRGVFFSRRARAASTASRRHNRGRTRQQPDRVQAQTRNHNVRQKSE